MKHEIKNLSPHVPMGGEGSFELNGIHYSIYERAKEDKAGSVLVSMVTQKAIKRENNGNVLRIPEAVKKCNNVFEVIGICGAAISGNINELYLPPTLEIFSGYSFCNCTIGCIYMSAPETDKTPIFRVENSSLIFDRSGDRLIYVSTNISIGLGEWRGTKIIGEYAFCNFKGKEITIPYSVEYVERMAFADAQSLKTVYFEEHIPCGVNISTFNLVYENVSLKLIRKP